jgi:hypothetical protein
MVSGFYDVRGKIGIANVSFLPFVIIRKELRNPIFNINNETLLHHDSNSYFHGWRRCAAPLCANAYLCQQFLIALPRFAKKANFTPYAIKQSAVRDPCINIFG